VLRRPERKGHGLESFKHRELLGLAAGLSEPAAPALGALARAAVAHLETRLARVRVPTNS
jgi:hypothetical protein